MLLTQKTTARSHTILFWLNCLVLASLIPAAAMTTANGLHAFALERTALQRDLIGTARALSQAVDAELAGARSALVVLGGSPYLASGDLASFYKEAQRALMAGIGDYIVLADV